MWNKQKAVFAILSVVIVAAPVMAGEASAASKKKLSYDQAWAHCKSLLDRERQPGDMSSGQHRIFRGRACMEKYGYKI